VCVWADELVEKRVPPHCTGDVTQDFYAANVCLASTVKGVSRCREIKSIVESSHEVGFRQGRADSTESGVWIALYLSA